MMKPIVNYYNREEFKQWLYSNKVKTNKLTSNSADQYVTYIGYIFDGRDLTQDERQNFSSAMKMYQKFLKDLP